jgi:hypothetical protein
MIATAIFQDELAPPHLATELFMMQGAGKSIPGLTHMVSSVPSVSML